MDAKESAHQAGSNDTLCDHYRDHDPFTDWMLIWKRIGKTLNITTYSGQCLTLVSQMTSINNRIGLRSARELFNIIRNDSNIKLQSTLINRIEMIINNELSAGIQVYVSELCDFR